MKRTPTRAKPPARKIAAPSSTIRPVQYSSVASSSQPATASANKPMTVTAATSNQLVF